MTIVEMLARNARTYPGDTALVELKPSHHFRKEITWKQFERSANKVGNALMSMGIKKGDKVLHLMMNSINWLEAYFGIVKTGAWAVPLNFRFTSDDIKYCADIAQAKVMFVGEEFVERVEAIRSELTTIEKFIYVGHQNNTPDFMGNFDDIVEAASDSPINVELSEEDECGLYFTSGTTGNPKPILLTHKNMESAAISENRHHLQEHEDNFILIPPLYHCGAKMHWFGHLIVGAKATILTEIKPKYILDAVDNERGTVVWLLVPWAHDILGALDRGELLLEDYDLECWRLMHIGAQPVPPSLVRRWHKYFPDMQYDDNYGLSESTGPGPLHLGINNIRKLGANGKAGFNWELRIVDDKGVDVPQGEVGELIARGNGVMREYYQNPELTAQTIKDGWLYTGDMARMDSEGFIYLVDRKKDVINTGGENIYPVEVEAVIQSNPKVYDVAVIGLPDERLVEIAVAVIDPKPGATLTEDEVKQYCEQNLPRYKRPRRVIFDKVPRNPTGKLEKRKLREKYSNY